MNYDSINYKKTFLNQVIVRIDFSEFLETENTFSDANMDAVQERFPRKGMRQVTKFQDVNVFVDDASSTTQHRIDNGFQQEFLNSDNNKCVISNKFLIFDVCVYSSFDQLMEDMKPIIMAVMDISKVTASRTGIRYINIYENDRIKLSKNLFNSPIGSFLNTSLLDQNEGMGCMRSMAMNEYKKGDMQLDFRYGMYNPDYPRPMKRSSFVLDYDCYTEDPLIGSESVFSHLIEGHNAIQHLFENSISYKLKQVMGVE